MSKTMVEYRGWSAASRSRMICSARRMPAAVIATWPLSPAIVLNLHARSCCHCIPMRVDSSTGSSILSAMSRCVGHRVTSPSDKSYSATR